MQLIPVPAFSDNYLWLLHDGNHALVVDPGDAEAVQESLAAHHLTLSAILVTHHHPDHINGVERLKQHWRCPVYAPDDARIPMRDFTVHDNSQVHWKGLVFQVMHVPGHTLTHVAYHANEWLFCGDTLFSIGCGRLFEGSPEQMWRSLQRLAALPETTQVCCAHEYTLANLDFALAVLPGDPELLAYRLTVQQRLRAGKPSLPSTLGAEKRLNPFLNTHRPDIQAATWRHCGRELTDEADIFACLRTWKDQF